MGRPFCSHVLHAPHALQEMPVKDRLMEVARTCFLDEPAGTFKVNNPKGEMMELVRAKQKRVGTYMTVSVTVGASGDIT